MTIRVAESLDWREVIYEGIELQRDLAFFFGGRHCEVNYSDVEVFEQVIDVPVLVLDRDCEVSPDPPRQAVQRGPDVDVGASWSDPYRPKLPDLDIRRASGEHAKRVDARACGDCLGSRFLCNLGYH